MFGIRFQGQCLPMTRGEQNVGKFGPTNWRQIQESRLNSVMSKRIEKGILELAYVVT